MPHPPDATRDNEALLTVADAAARLSVSQRTLRSLVALGRLRVIRVSPGRIAIDPADLRDYVARQRHAGR